MSDVFTKILDIIPSKHSSYKYERIHERIRKCEKNNRESRGEGMDDV
jgi:hypothetical protein